MELHCRMLPLETADGPYHMAADETLLHAAAAGVTSLRFYTWSPATISLGYFQAADSRLRSPAHAQLPFVRRPSGGDALIHDRELTYCLALPVETARQKPAWPQRMHAIIAATLRRLGIAAELARCAAPEPFGGFLCFAHRTPGDLLLAGAKIAGSAQRRQRGALMQHGGILLAASPFEGALPGIKELCGRDLSAPILRELVVQEFAHQTGWSVEAGGWTEAESQHIQELASTKYGQDWWNRKR